jgi:hypothetical protein
MNALGGEGQSLTRPEKQLQPFALANQRINMQWLGPLPQTDAQPRRRKGHTLTRVLRSGILILYGGQGKDNNYLGDMHAFNPVARTWSPIQYATGSPTPAARALHSMTAISETTLVLFGGDSGIPGYPTSLNDTWTFDLQARTWRCVSDISEGETVPFARSSHTAVYGELAPPHGPALYIYGGVGSGRNAVFRLRTSCWKWELLNIKVEDEQQTAGPVEREQHAAVWWPATTSMVIIGGDGSAALLGDVWQLTPLDLKLDSCDWTWRRMRIAIGGNASVNRIVPCAAHSVIQLESDPSQLILWGGVSGEGLGLAPTNSGTLINLEKRVSERFDIAGLAPSAGRVMHTLVAFRNLDEHFVLLYGGCALDGALETTTHIAALLATGRPTGGVEFGPAKAARQVTTDRTVGRAEGQPMKMHVQDGSQKVDEKDRAREDGMITAEDSENAVLPQKRRFDGEDVLKQGTPARPVHLQIGRSLSKAGEPADGLTNVSADNLASGMRMSLIPSGTPLSGRILDSTEVGHFVSVIIEGKEFKGVLVTRPSAVKEVPIFGPQEAICQDELIEPEKEKEVHPDPEKSSEGDALRNGLSQDDDGTEEVVASGHIPPMKMSRADAVSRTDPLISKRVVPFLPDPREDRPTDSVVIDLD